METTPFTEAHEERKRQRERERENKSICTKSQDALSRAYLQWPNFPPLGHTSFLKVFINTLIMSVCNVLWSYPPPHLLMSLAFTCRPSSQITLLLLLCLSVFCFFCYFCFVSFLVSLCINPECLITTKIREF